MKFGEAADGGKGSGDLPRRFNLGCRPAGPKEPGHGRVGSLTRNQTSGPENFVHMNTAFASNGPAVEPHKIRG